MQALGRLALPAPKQRAPSSGTGWGLKPRPASGANSECDATILDVLRFLRLGELLAIEPGLDGIVRGLGRRCVGGVDLLELARRVDEVDILVKVDAVGAVKERHELVEGDAPLRDRGRWEGTLGGR